MPSKIYPNWDFWFENKPSGNPATHVYAHQWSVRNCPETDLTFDAFMARHFWGWANFVRLEFVR
jgi:hypothetical protein